MWKSEFLLEVLYRSSFETRTRRDSNPEVEASLRDDYRDRDSERSDSEDEDL